MSFRGSLFLTQASDFNNPTGGENIWTSARCDLEEGSAGRTRLFQLQVVQLLVVSVTSSRSSRLSQSDTSDVVSARLPDLSSDFLSRSSQTCLKLEIL